MTARHILLVEDSDDDAELTIAALEDYRLANRIERARDGAEAIAYLQCTGAHAGRDSGNPVLILLDVKMPKVDGIEVLRVIKSDEKLMTIPVVMLTSSREDRDVIESYRGGVNAYVVKPVDFRGFSEAVRELGLFWLVLNVPLPSGD
jgi:CheY-like chemotaxis protein